MLFPNLFHFPSHSKGTLSKKKNLLTKIPPLAHIPPRNLLFSFPHLCTQSPPPRPQQQQPPPSPPDQCHQFPVARKANPARQTGGLAVRDRRRKTRSTLMGPRCHSPTQSKNPARGAVHVGPSPTHHNPWTTPFLPSHPDPNPHRPISTQMTCSLTGKSHPHHEACIQTRNLGSRVLRVDFWTNVFMYPKVLLAPRVGQYIRSGRYTYVGSG